MKETIKIDEILQGQEELAKFLDLFAKIEKSLSEQKITIVGIDGNSGSGKSTLANSLKRIYGADIIPMDDFFLPLELRHEARLKEAGGNIHHERFKTDIIDHLEEDTISYRAFDCSVMSYGDEKSIKTKPLLIVEGVYSFHPSISDIYDIKIFMCATKEEQIERILKRSSKKQLERYLNEWIPLEDYYIKSFNLKDNCDFIF